ncbi:MAG: hypothetical protein ABR608_14365 [Pseudonocardiaceae bacterium]
MLTRSGMPSGVALPAGLGPPPDGDPEGMLALADQLRGFARILGAQSKVDLQNWESRRGREVKTDIQQAVNASHRGSDRLEQLAAEIRRAAERLRQEQLDWSVRYSRAINADSTIPRNKV